jgi:hypothetical protein
MSDESMILRSEDPVPYRCDAERKLHPRLMEHDGRIATVLTWRTVGSIEGDSLAWRFITANGTTVAVRPVQVPSNARPFCVPAQIVSALNVAAWLVRLAHGTCHVRGQPEEPDWEAIDRAAREATSHTAHDE